MSYFALLWKARTIENCRLQYEKEKYKSIEKNNLEVPVNSLCDRWRRCRRNTKKKILESLKTKCPKGSIAFNFFVYLRTDQTFPNFLLKSVIGFFGGILLTYLCFMFFIFQLSISLIHATIMSSVIGVLLTLGLAFSYRVRCLVFLLIPQFFSRVGRYTLTCYALVLILTGPATNTLKNSEVLSESMACSQEQIKTSVNQIRDSMKKPLHLIKDSIELMIVKVKEVGMEINKAFHNIDKLVLSIAAVLQSSSDWLDSVVASCNKNLGSPYQHCIKYMNKGISKCKAEHGPRSPYCNSDFVQSVCTSLKNKRAMCHVVDFMGSSVVATIKKRLKVFFKRIDLMIDFDVHTHTSYIFTNTNHSASQVAAGIVTEIRNRADPLLTWLSWSSCVTSLFLLLIIFRAKYYQNMYETRSRFDNRYITQELRKLDLQRMRQGRETILPLNRRERIKYINTISFRLIPSERINLSRSIVFMIITTFKLLIHMVADYSLYWVLTTMRYYGRLQSPLQPGPPNAGIIVSGEGPVGNILRSLIESLTVPLQNLTPSSIQCLPNPYRPDLGRYSQIGVLIFLLWVFALFEPYGLRLRHVIMGHYRPERAKARATWLYNHILRTRGGFMKYARRKLHRQYKCLTGEHLTFRFWMQSYLPCSWIQSLFGFGPVESKCLLCSTKTFPNDPDTELIRCETSKCPGTYCAKCFTDIGELCTICLSPVDYGDLSDLSLEKGSSSESYDSDEDIKGYSKLPKDLQAGPSNQRDWQTYFYKNVHYKESNRIRFDKSDTNNTSKSNTRSQHRLHVDTPIENDVNEWTEDECLYSLSSSSSNIEDYTMYLRKATLVRRKKRCHKQETTRKPLEQTQSGNQIDKHNNLKYPQSVSQRRETNPSKVNDTVKTVRKYKAIKKCMSSNKFRRNKISIKSFCHKLMNPSPKMRVFCHRRKTINLKYKLRKRNLTKCIICLKTKLNNQQNRFNNFVKCHRKFHKEFIESKSNFNSFSNPNTYPSAFCSPHCLSDIDKRKRLTICKAYRLIKLAKKMRNRKSSISNIKGFLHSYEQKCQVPHYLQSRKFLRTEALRYNASDIDRLNFLHNITVCSFNNKKAAKENTKRNIKEANTLKFNECCCEEIIKNKSKLQSSKNCTNKNLFTRCYLYWLNIKPKSRTTLIAESKRKSNKLRDENKNYKRRKKHKSEYKELEDNKFDKVDDEKTRKYRLTSYLDSQEWYKPQNEIKEKVDKDHIPEKKIRVKHTTKDKKKKVKVKNKIKSTNMPNKTANIILNVKSLNKGAVTNKTKIHACTEVKKKIKSDATKSSSEQIILIENYNEFGIEEKVKEILQLEPDELCQQSRFSNLRIAESGEKIEETIISNKSGTSKQSNVKDKESSSCSVKESRNAFTIMKTLCTSILSFKSNKGIQKDSDKISMKIKTSDKDLQTEREGQCKIDISVQTETFQATADKQIDMRPNVSNSTCQYLADEDWQRSTTTQTSQEKWGKPLKKYDVQVGTLIQKCTCATQYTAFTKDIGTNHRNSLLKLVNCGIQCTRSPILTNRTTHNIFHNKNDLNIINEVSESIMKLQSSEENITSSVTSEDSERSEGAKTDTTVCSYVTMEYLDKSSKEKNKRYKIVLITKANRSTTTEKTEICNASTVTDDWWSPMSERKELKKPEKKKSGKPRSRRIKLKEAGATTEGRIVKFRSKTKIIPAGAKEILSPSRYLLESQKYYNELFSDLYQTVQKQKGDQPLLNSQRKYHNIVHDDIRNKYNANETVSSLQEYTPKSPMQSKSFHPYKLVHCQCNKLDLSGKSNISAKTNTTFKSCQKCEYEKGQNSCTLKRAEPNTYLPRPQLISSNELLDELDG